MGRPPERAPRGLFTLADAARIIGEPRDRLAYWCAQAGANLVTPQVAPGIQGGSRLLSERDLAKLAVIPKLLQAGIGHTLIANMFTKAKPAWWDLSTARDQNPDWLEWIVLLLDSHFRPTWRLLLGVYEQGPSSRIGEGALKSFEGILNGFMFHHGGMAGFHVVELSNLKRALLERMK